jgi:excinuclease ABC subunit A
VACGTPEEVARRRSLTGGYLREILRHGHLEAQPDPPADGAAEDAAAITVVGARQNNLCNVSLRLPKEQVVAFAGPSGAGKTSLALDTIYAEGQRRYVESLSAYARQFLGRAPRPAVDRVDGLCPAISVDQRAVPANARSTVATLTEIHDYLRLLFCRAGEPFCPRCGGAVAWLGGDRIAELAAEAFPGERLVVLAPADLGGGSFADWAARHRRAGYLRYWRDGEVRPLEGDDGPGPDAEPRLALVADRVAPGDPGRLREAVEAAFAAAEGPGRDEVGFQPEGGAARWWRRGYACGGCGAGTPPLLPHTFAFNDPRGWCPVCEGTGSQRRGQWETLVPDPRLSLADGGIGVWGSVRDGPMAAVLRALGRRHGFRLAQPLCTIPARAREVLLAGDPEPLELDLGGGLPATVRYTGLWAGLERARAHSHSGELVQPVAALYTEAPCPGCGGSRLAEQGRSVRLGGRTLPELVGATLRECRDFFAELRLPPEAEAACAELRAEVSGRLRFLCEVGLDYLTLGTASAALSGGEGQRIRLASQLGSSLTGVLYVLDEPTVGLHPRDTERLVSTLRGLRDLGNTVLSVDHDAQLLAASDHLVVFGPGSGARGGRVVAQGAPADVAGALVRGEGGAVGEARRRQGDWLVVRRASHHNLRGVDAAFPLANLIAVTGVSGSGKTSLVVETLCAALARRLHRAQGVPGAHEGIDGLELVDKVIHVDQAPISETPRSNAATYTGVFDVLRRLYARVPEARARGFDADHFSYNHPQGRCEHCEGHGQIRIQMHFLPDVWVPCEACGGRRYRGDVLQILYRGRTIADCLDLTVDEACHHFNTLKSIRPTLEMLSAVGLGYLRLGQPAPTLSAGESQRLKLARELSRPATGRTLFVLDEPTTGLSGGEVGRLLAVLEALVDAGNTVICIEHDLDVMAAADWILDLGPEGGPDGGRIVAAGTPEAVAAAPGSRTAPFLARRLGLAGSGGRALRAAAARGGAAP